MNNLRFLALLFMMVQFGLAFGQQKVSIYNPDADARKDIKTAIAQAVADHKHVLIQVGGNWCPWCVKINHLFHSDQKIDSLLQADYIIVHVNYSKENKNLPVLRELDFPQRFGFPVLVVLDQTGKRIHTQDTGFLEAGDGYDSDKVITFLKNWSVKAINPKTYE
jgi:thiol:disulfide interchange protein